MNDKSPFKQIPWWAWTIIILGTLLQSSVFVWLLVPVVRQARNSDVPQEQRLTQQENAQPIEEEQVEWVTLTRSVDGEILVDKISIWEKAGGGGVDNLAIGRVSHNTKVQLLGTKEVDGRRFYHIVSTTGEYSALSNVFIIRKRQMNEIPESRWYVKASELLTINGWVAEDFVEPRL